MSKLKNHKGLHKKFKLNGRSFQSVNELLIYSQSLSNNIFSFLKLWFDNSDFITVNTSGSTGKPSTIQLQKKFMVNSAQATANYFDLPENSSALMCLSPNYIAGKMMLVRAIISGWNLDIVEPSSNPLDQTNSNYDFCAMVPLQLSNSLSQLHRIKKLIVGGASVTDDLIEKLQNIKTEVFATYGMTETITHIAIKPLSGFSSAGLVSAPNFKTLPNVKISKDNRDCLVISAHKISENLIITNDVVELISKTEFKWLGRYDNVINSGGIKLIPEQIEKKLAKVITVRFFVAGLPDEVLGEKLVLVIENDKIQDVISNKVRNLSNLNKFEIPKEFYFLEKFVETETKKIQRQQTLDLIIHSKK